MRQQHWLDLLEYLLIAIALVAIVPTAITGQPLYAIVPLILLLGLNRLNRDRFQQTIESTIVPLYQLQGGVQEIQQEIQSSREAQRLQSEQLSALSQNYQILQVQASEYEQLKQQVVSLAQQLVQYETLAEEAIAATQQQVDTTQESLIQRLNQLEMHCADLGQQTQQIEALQASINQVTQVKATQESLVQRLNQLEMHCADLGQQIQSEVEEVKEAITQFTPASLSASPETEAPEANVTPPEPTVEEMGSFIQNGSQDDSTSSQPPRSEDFIADLQDNYHRLRDLLATGQWLQADRETKVLMLKACGKTQESKLDTDAIAHFPCKDLWTIDRLWLYYSQGRFGFTVQKQIYDAVGKDYENFGDRIQWQVNRQWKNYADLNFSLDSAPGHLPLGALIADTNLGWFGFEWASLFARIEKCQVAAKI